MCFSADSQLYCTPQPSNTDSDVSLDAATSLGTELQSVDKSTVKQHYEVSRPSKIRNLWKG